MNTIEHLTKRFSGLEDIKKLQNQFYKKKISVSYEPVVNGVRRIIFTGIKSLRNGDFDDIQRECNGLILEAPEWKPLMIPTNTSRSNIQSNLVNNWLAKDLYDIYSIEDGSIINLYYYGNKWVIATNRGLDMNDTIFNNLSYEQILKDILQKMDLLNDFYHMLDTKKCYVFGIKHPDLHPFYENGNPIYKIWFVQAIDTKTHERINEFSQKVPRQEKVYVGTNIHFLFKRLSTAITYYESHNIPNYGYILVSKNTNITRSHSALILESSLLKYIRNTCYNKIYTDISRKYNFNKEKVIVLAAFLEGTKYKRFKEYFPQYIEVANEIENGEKKLIKSIIEDASDGNACETFKKIVGEATSLVNCNNKELAIVDIIRNISNIDIYYLYLYGSE